MPRGREKSATQVNSELLAAVRAPPIREAANCRHSLARLWRI